MSAQDFTSECSAHLPNALLGRHSPWGHSWQCASWPEPSFPPRIPCSVAVWESGKRGLSQSELSKRQSHIDSLMALMHEMKFKDPSRKVHCILILVTFCHQRETACQNFLIPKIWDMQRLPVTYPFATVVDFECEGEGCARHLRRWKVDHIVVQHGELH